MYMCIYMYIDLVFIKQITMSIIAMTSAAVCPSGGIRLVGNSATNNKGTVELCLNNTWGTICDHNWDDTDASVVCNQLGYYGT